MLQIKDLNIVTGDFSVNSASFKVEKGEYYFLLGESGSGKTMVLEAIAGIRRVSSGNIFVDGNDITNKPIDKRSVGIVFQNLALFPHKTVFQNIAFPLKRKGLPKNEIINEVDEMAEKLSIYPLLKRFPKTLSGGEHQRVALARTLILQPKVLLLDEPLSSLDILLKEEMIDVLKEVHKYGQTILHVTHDYHVVSKLADRISIIEKGEIVQSGSLADVAKNPKCKLAERLVSHY